MGNSNISISILIPVYNVQSYLKECLDSILLQIDNSAEVIVMNDASTDDSRKILAMYEKHEKITIIDAPYNRGLSGTRNALLKLANNNYVWFLDSDDVLYQNAYNTVVNQLRKMPVDILCGDYIAWQGNNKRYKKCFVGRSKKIFFNQEQSFLKNIIKNNSNHVWNKIYRREILIATPFLQGKKFEDIYFMTDISFVCKNYAYIKQPLIYYRERDNSIVSTIDKKYIDDYLNAFIYRVEQWQAKNENKDYFFYYLLYKCFNRYAGLIFKLKKSKQVELIKYINEKYSKEFLNYKILAEQELSWLYRKKMNYNNRKVLQLMLSQNQR